MIYGDRPTEDSVLAVTADVHVVELDDEVVVLQTRRNTLHRLNLTGSALWFLFDAETSLAALATEVADATGLELTVAIEQVVELATQLLEAELVEVVDTY